MFVWRACAMLRLTMSSTSKLWTDAHVCVCVSSIHNKWNGTSKSIRGYFLMENRREKKLRHSFGISIGFVWFWVSIHLFSMHFHCLWPNVFHLFYSLDLLFAPTHLQLFANTCRILAIGCYFFRFIFENLKSKFWFRIFWFVYIFTRNVWVAWSIRVWTNEKPLNTHIQLRRGKRTGSHTHTHANIPESCFHSHTRAHKRTLHVRTPLFTRLE